MRKLLYAGVILLCAAAVYYKSAVIAEHQKKEIISINSEWEKNGRPVELLEIGRVDMIFTTKVSGFVEKFGEINARVSADVAGALKAGQKFKTYYGDDGLSFASGEVAYISRGVDMQTGLFETRLKISGAVPDELKNKIVAAKVQTGLLKGVIAVPNEAVYMDNGKRYCWVISKDNTAEKRFLAVGESNDTHIRAAGGLSSGERIAYRGGYFLEEGGKVCICEMRGAEAEK